MQKQNEDPCKEVEKQEAAEAAHDARKYRQSRTDVAPVRPDTHDERHHHRHEPDAGTQFQHLLNLVHLDGRPAVVQIAN